MPYPTTQSWVYATFFFNAPATTQIYTLSLHDALPICPITAGSNHGGISPSCCIVPSTVMVGSPSWWTRSEEHTSELQSRRDLVCRLLLEKKKNNTHRPKLESTLPVGILHKNFITLQ